MIPLFLINNIKSISISVLIIISLIMFASLKLENSHLKNERDKALLLVDKTNQQIKEQNMAIETWKQEAEAGNKKLRTAEKKAHDNSVKIQELINKTMMLNPPKECSQAIDWAVVQARSINNESEEED